MPLVERTDGESLRAVFVFVAEKEGKKKNEQSCTSSVTDPATLFLEEKDEERESVLGKKEERKK